MISPESDALGVFRDNIRWISDDMRTHEVISSGVLREAAEYFIKSNGGVLPEPVEALAFLTGISDDCSAREIFPDFSAELLRVKNTTESPRRRLSGTVAFLNSPISDAAFIGFSEAHPSLSAVPGESFKDICEGVFYDRTYACILPLDSSSEGLFMSFRQMLLKYELSIASVCRVAEEESFRSFALLTSNAEIGDGEYSEYFFSSLSKADTALLLNVTDRLGADTVRCCSFESSIAGERELHVCLKLPSKNHPAVHYCILGLFPAAVHLGDYNMLYKSLN